MFRIHTFKVLSNLTLLVVLCTGQVAAAPNNSANLTLEFSQQTLMVAGGTIRVSISSSGVQGDSSSQLASISADGRYVVFFSNASNLVSGDTNGNTDVFVRDTQTNATTLVSISSGGVQGNSSSLYNSISADGRYVVFFSNASNLVSGDTNGSPDIFVRDTQTNTTTRVSISSSGVQGNSASYFPSISADGRYVAFSSFASNLVNGDTNGNYDIFVRDTQMNTTTRVSLNSSGEQGNSPNTDFNMLYISADGRYVAFSSFANNLVNEDTNGMLDVFVRDTQTNTTTRVSLDSNGVQGSSDSHTTFISADGRHVVFYSSASNLVNGDTNGTNDVFVRDTQTNTTTRVSLNSNGVQAIGDSFSGSISDDGRYVTFESSASNLISGDTNGSTDVFVRDTLTNTTTRVSLDSNGVQGNSNSQRSSISADGKYVAFESTANNLVNGDTNGQDDIFVHVNNIVFPVSPSISGNAGVIGATLNYIDGTTKSVIADGNGHYALTVPYNWSGTVTPSKIGYTFAPSNRVYANLQSNQTNQNYMATQYKPPLILVHGFQGIPGNSGYHCSDGIQKYNGTNSTLGSLPSWFLPDYEVWIAHLESTQASTPSLYTNAQCLRDQINSVALVNPQPITIVAHSMGGLVSRASLYYIRGDVRIDALYTLGSPHAGFPFDILQLIYANKQPAVYDMEETQMAVFNDANENLEDVKYYFIGGDATPPGLGWLNFPFVGSNDGLVGKYNAVGWEYPNKTFTSDWASPLSGQYWTNEVHISEWGNSYYSAPSGDLYSDSYECMKDLLKHLDPDPLFCQDSTNANATDQTLMAQSSPPLLSAFTELKNGHLNAAQSISIPLQIDTNTASLFYLTWSGNIPTFTLTRPDTQVINPAYAVAHPSEVTYENFIGGAGAPPYAVYNFNITQSGTWQLNIVATGATDYQAFAAFDSSRILTAQTNAGLYQIGDVATITANLDSSGTGLSGATLTATLTSPDDVIAVITLTDQGNGTYTNTYNIPDAPGYLTIDITASGTDNGTAFTRQENLIASIAPNDLQLTGTYNDQPRDDNADGIYDFLDFSAGANLAAPGEYAVSAELYAGDQLITQSGDFFQLVDGTQTVTLSFDGGAIREAGLNGPYIVKNLYFTPIDIGITAANVGNAWTTPAYSYTQFGTHVCYTLTLSHSGSGSNPTISLANSTGCASGEYIAGEIVDLTASPNPAWHITGWTGTSNDASVASLNTLTMPANNHTASVIYQPNIVQLQAKSQAANDGWILESTETSGVGGTMNSAATTINLGDNAAKKQYRSILSFNTASLPDNAIITKVTLKLKKQGIVGGGNPVTMFQGFVVDIKKGMFGTAPLALGDFKAAASKTVGPTSPSLTSGWYNLNLINGKDFINKLGLTQVRLRFKLDDNNNAIANFLKIYSGNAGAANRPQLVIEYYVP